MSLKNTSTQVLLYALFFLFVNSMNLNFCSWFLFPELCRVTVFIFIGLFAKGSWPRYVNNLDLQAFWISALIFLKTCIKGTEHQDFS